jgi:3-hydroxybutyryl-CoA dehydratase
MSAIPFETETAQKAVFAKTVSESDVYGFAGITGDFSPNHVNAQAMGMTEFGHRVAHGVLTLGLASTAASKFIAEAGLSAVSYGYDHVRFTKPVFFGDTVTVTYEITDVDHVRNQTRATVTAVNQHGAVVMAAQHILKFFRTTGN